MKRRYPQPESFTRGPAIYAGRCPRCGVRAEREYPDPWDPWAPRDIIAVDCETERCDRSEFVLERANPYHEDAA